METRRPFSSLNWDTTPELVRRYIEHLEKTHVMLVDKVERLEKRIEQLEHKLNQNSQNSSKPPSSDSPFKKKENQKEQEKKGRSKVT